jgi:hypothetical protein
VVRSVFSFSNAVYIQPSAATNTPVSVATVGSAADGIVA